jgi:hypothetical protein
VHWLQKTEPPLCKNLSAPPPPKKNPGYPSVHYRQNRLINAVVRIDGKVNGIGIHRYRFVVCLLDCVPSLPDSGIPTSMMTPSTLGPNAVVNSGTRSCVFSSWSKGVFRKQLSRCICCKSGEQLTSLATWWP